MTSGLLREQLKQDLSGGSVLTLPFISMVKLCHCSKNALLHSHSSVWLFGKQLLSVNVSKRNCPTYYYQIRGPLFARQCKAVISRDREQRSVNEEERCVRRWGLQKF